MGCSSLACGVSPFVVTLGTLGIARGLAVWLAGRTLITFPRDGRPEWVDTLARVHAGWTVFNPGFWSLVVLAGVVAVLLRFTVLGRYCYAIGSNEATARLCGVAVERTKVWIYTLAGLLTGWAGVLMFAHGGSGDPSGARGDGAARHRRRGHRRRGVDRRPGHRRRDAARRPDLWRCWATA